MTQEDPNKPSEARQFDRVQASLWRHEDDSGSPDKAYWTFSVSRSFKADNGEWKRTHSFTERDLPHLALAVEWAMKELMLKKE
jgi:hypothetical protein